MIPFSCLLLQFRREDYLVIPVHDDIVFVRGVSCFLDAMFGTFFSELRLKRCMSLLFVGNLLVRQRVSFREFFIVERKGVR